LFFPKKTDFNFLEKGIIKRVIKEKNNKGVKKYGYLALKEIFLTYRKCCTYLLNSAEVK